MFCSNCGAQIEDGVKYCPNCGTPVDTGDIKGFVYNDTINMSNEGASSDPNPGGSYSGNSSDGSFSGNGYNGSFSGNSGAGSFSGSYTSKGGAGNGFTYNQPYGVLPLRTDRTLLMFIVLSIITCGIYWYIFMYQIIRDINTACDGDGEETPGLLIFLLLSIVTCGIYCYYWYYKVGNRLAVNAGRYGFTVTENGTTILLWMLLGQFACGIGPFIAWHILITNTNLVCTGYNRAHGVG